VISFEPLQRGVDAAEAAIREAEDQLVTAIKAQEARDALYAKRDQLATCASCVINTLAIRPTTRPIGRRFPLPTMASLGSQSLAHGEADRTSAFD
jgi:hypothetical protein